MSHLLQWRELAYLCKQGVSYPFSGSDYDKSSRPTTIKIGRVTRLFLNGITDVFSFSPHLRRTSGIIHPHMFIINATKHHPVPSRTRTQTTNCTCISHIYKHRNATVDIILPALLKYGDGKEHVFSESSSADIQSVSFLHPGLYVVYQPSFP